SDTSTLNKVGDLYVRLKRMDKAIDLFRRAAEHFAQEELFVKAIAIYKKIIRLEPTRIDVYETLADLYDRQGLATEAKTQYQVVSDYYAQSGDPGKVITIQERLVGLEEGDPTARVKLAELYCEASRFQDAMNEYREIAGFMITHDKVAEAVKVYSGAFELDTKDIDYLTDALFHLKDGGYREAALKLLDYAVERDPDAARAGSLAGLTEARGLTDGQGPASPIETGEAAAEDVEPVPKVDEEITAELDVEELPEPSSSPPAPVEPRETDDGGEFELDLSPLEAAPKNLTDAIDAAAADPTERISSRVAELFTEARILSNYGLESKATDLCDQILDLDPEHLEACALAVRLHAADHPDRAVTLAKKAFALAEAEGRDQLWAELSEFLEEEGFDVDGSDVSPPVVAPVPEPGPEPELPSGTATDLQVEAETETLPETEPETEPEVVPSSDERLDWLRSDASPVPETTADDLFGDEEEFFDLAAELEQELRGEEFLDAEFEASPPEQSLEEIVEGFRKGVAETLSDEDYDTHYNLGIAYREMGLVDEAIGEFQLSAKDPRYLVECCSLLGACFLEKGFPDLAAKWFERGLKSEHITEKETLGLLYELGNLYASTGEREAALETFAEIYGINSNYRDVVARLEELKQAD
ncbi:MAG: hypothetical protein OES47_13550, partial [Acidobacteriota bacterium]|nr:hypothetical protein [Acidobacteriota bacterium]